MKVLKIEVNDEQYEVIQKKLGANVDMSLRIAIEDYVNKTVVPEPLPAIDLSGRSAVLRRAMSDTRVAGVKEPEKRARRRGGHYIPEPV